MGSSQSYPGLTEDLLDDYTNLTYLKKGEILHLMKKFNSIDPEKLEADYHHRFPKEDIMNKFGALRNNPFSDRIFRVFSSKQDDCFSFEDMLDLCSVMSSDCPPEVKAAWAFRIFDIDEDNQITESDICEIINRLTAPEPTTGERYLDECSKEKIAKIILQEISLDKNGGIAAAEFKYMISRLSEFETSFYFRL
ncbi:calcium and integrin-binding protein 1-like [Ostrinia furnacalis]|uniref:calcium and integrin-binding protein 1-like n=1 Tax=Ostrinia furnacalis TaxID=93504 RepID=UPI001038E82D|nr:calcium and integrin-binding protein 1-like [Ostrinia furnacalis]